MRGFTSKYKRDIIIGVIVSLITLVISKTVEWFVFAAPKIGSSISETIRNFIYTLAGARLNFTIFSILLSAVMIVFAFSLLNNSQKFKRETDMQEPRYIRIINSGIICILLCYYMFLMVFAITPITLNEGFEHDIAIIYPYVEEKDILFLKSDWALMRSRDDYIAIYEYIDKVKEDYGLTFD